MLQKPNWGRSLARWRAFWEGRLDDRPPIIAHIVPTNELDPGPSPTAQSALDPYDLASNGPLLAAAEHATLDRAAQVRDDLPPAIIAGGGVWFTGAVYGAPLRITADMMTTTPILNDWAQADALRLALDEGWAQRALALAEQLAARSGGRYAVTAGLLEGPSDMCANLRGPTPLAADLYEHPAEVRAFARRAADDWQTFTRALWQRIPLYDGGTVTQWGLFAPGRAIALQEDFCTLVSPRQFRELFLPLDIELARGADIAWMHLHAGQVHLVDEVLTADAIRGVQIVNDGVASPPLSRVLPAMQRVQQRGRCLIIRKYPPEELAEILPQLSLRGLAIDTYFATSEAANAWLAQVGAHLNGS